MLTEYLFLFTFFCILGTGLMGGIFFAFSSFVMKALSRLPQGQGIRAMQAINVTVLNPLFLTAFLGTALLGFMLAVAACFRLGQKGAVSLLAAGLLYGVGSAGVTMFCNVPLNDELAGADPDTTAGGAVWKNYLRTWVRWNHVRTACSLAASAAYIEALRTL
jgi:uncharacterized membrane protein